MNVAKMSNGNWDTVASSHGEHDALAKRQTHINENWYPSNRHLELEPLERRMLFINQQAQKAAEGGRPVQSVSAVSVDDSTISQLTTAVTSMTGTLEALANLSAKHACKIKQIRAIQQDDTTEDLFESSSNEEEQTNRNNPALARNKLKTYPRGIMKKRQKRV